MTDEKDTQSSSSCIFCLRLFLWHGMSSRMFCLIKLRICYIYIYIYNRKIYTTIEFDH
jgi:hypothetical protein